MRTLLLYFILIVNIIAQDEITNFNTFLTNNHISFKQTEELGNSKASYTAFISQPLDHSDSNSALFNQKIYINYVGKDNPTLLVTEGYSAYTNYVSEIADLLNANQIIVEHRFFGESKPEGNPWQYLTTEQAANDHKKIIDLFKQCFSGKWLASGISKGGQTTCFLKYYFPNAVDVSLPYVAPINIMQEDPRIHLFLNMVGTPECRKKIIGFQRAVLSNRDSMLTMVKDYANDKNLSFTRLGIERAFEYAVMEYSFSFWQWHYSNCIDIPDASSNCEVLFKHLMKISGIESFGDAGILEFEPFYYQAYQQIGYYCYNTYPLKDLIKVAKHPSNVYQAPQGIEYKFDVLFANSLAKYLQTVADNMIYIYGGLDPWTGSMVQLNGENNSVTIVKQDGDHRTRINNLPEEQYKTVINKLEEWLDMEIQPNK